MDGTTYTTIVDALKRDYLPDFAKQIEKKVKTWDIFSKSTEGVKGRDIYLKMFRYYPQGVGAAAAGETLPTPSGAGYAEAKVSAKRNYAVIQFDAMLDEDKTGIVDLIDFEMQAVEESLQKELNYQLAFGDGSSSRGEVASASDSNASYDNQPTITFDAGTNKDYTGHEIDFFYENMEITVYNALTNTPRGSYTIKAVYRAAKTIVLTAGATPATDTVADGDQVYRKGNKDLAMQGIPGVVNKEGALQTLNPATEGYEWWKSFDKDMGAKWGTGDADFLDRIQETIDEIELNSIGKIDLIYAVPLFARQYRFSMEAKRRIVNTLDFKEGRKAIAYVTEEGEIGIMREKYLPHKKVYFLDSDRLAIKTLKGLHWEERGGGILKILERKDIYTAWMKLYSEFATTTRNAHGYWWNCPTTVGDYT